MFNFHGKKTKISCCITKYVQYCTKPTQADLLGFPRVVALQTNKKRTTDSQITITGSKEKQEGGLFGSVFF